MRGADLWDPLEEYRPPTLRTRGRGVACRWQALMLITPTVLWAGLAYAEPSWIDEVKLGVLAHDIHFLSDHVEPGADINVEVLFSSPALLRVLGAPRPHLGLSLNTAGATNYAHGGLTWRGRPWGRLRVIAS